MTHLDEFIEEMKENLKMYEDFYNKAAAGDSENYPMHLDSSAEWWDDFMQYVGAL